MNRTRECVLVFGLATVAGILLIGAARTIVVNAAGTFTVSNTDDGGTGSLRKAITDANAAAGGTIIFTAEATGTINLLNALPALRSNIEINGPGAEILTVQRSAMNQNTFNIFMIDRNATATISGLTIANGFSPTGGGIANFGNLTVNNCTIANNRGHSGGGIHNEDGTLTINNSTIANNFADCCFGGGIFNVEGNVVVSNSAVTDNVGDLGGGIGSLSGGTLIVSQCTVARNTGVVGGGIYSNLSNLTVNASTIANNSVIHASASVNGGGIAILGMFTHNTISNSTIANNSAIGFGGGGGLLTSGTLTVSNSTIAGNHASGFGGGGGLDISGTLTLQSTIVAKNTGSTPDMSGSFSSGGHNVIGDTTNNNGADISQGDLINIDPMLDLDGMGKPLLKNNGGPTQTISLLSSSPAIDQGKNLSASTTDQRGPGFVRTYDDPVVSNAIGGDGTDIGSLEAQVSFDFCMQDDGGSAALQINTRTGDYRFCCGGRSYVGKGTVTIKASLVTLQDYRGDRRLTAKVDKSAGKATASLQLQGGTLCTIIDRNTNNSSCMCGL